MVLGAEPNIFQYYIMNKSDHKCPRSTTKAISSFRQKNALCCRSIYTPRPPWPFFMVAEIIFWRKEEIEARLTMLLTYAPSAAAATPWPACAGRLPLQPRCAREGVDTHNAAVPTKASAALLQHGLRAESLPRHVAMVMDGNSRWARERGLPADEVHQAGRHTMEQMVRLSRAWGVRALTAFAFSHENLSRPKEEVDYLMGILEGSIRDMTDEFQSTGIRFHVIGDSSGRPASLMSAARKAYEATRNNSDLIFMLAIGYSGLRDIVQACRGLAEEARDGQIRPEDIDDALITGRLWTSVAGEFSCPDLVIRTSGELRLSNFLLWQSAYSELFFSDKLWPDFDEDEYIRALVSYQSRDRRFGKRKL